MTCPRLLGPHVCETAIHIHDGTNINSCFVFPIVEISLCLMVNLNLYVRAIYSTYAPSNHGECAASLWLTRA